MELITRNVAKTLINDSTAKPPNNSDSKLTVAQAIARARELQNATIAANAMVAEDTHDMHDDSTE